jgi:hypothetical protein
MTTRSLWRTLVVALLLLQAVPSFYVAMNFLMAETAEQAAARGRAMPPGWSSGVWNHGRYLRWDSIGEQPWKFGAACFGLGAAVTTLFLGALFSGAGSRDEQATAKRLEAALSALSQSHGKPQ